MAEQKGLKNRGHSRADVDERRTAAEEFTGAKLETIAAYGFEPLAAVKTIEIMTGMV